MINGMEDLSRLRESFLKDVEAVLDGEALERVRVAYLGRNGRLTAILRSLGDLTLEERKTIGPKAQALRTEFESLLAEKLAAFRISPVSLIDLTAPGKKFNRGHLHPLTLAYRDMCRIFRELNFIVVEGPEIESTYYNFDALNFPLFHPAKEMQDTFWLDPKLKKMDERGIRGESLLPRTQVSNMQIRFPEKHEPPFRIFYPGRVFRNEAEDAGHAASFYQAEAMAIDRDLSLANFKFVIETFFKKFFAGQKIEFRYRPSYFPFTEPSVEIDIKFRGKWFEVMGAGMTHPNVLKASKIDPREWQGFAFGMGLDRLTMIKYDIPDVRLFYSGDLRFVNQF
jgi:phenylalanyl-tRNA synthetase alpha chain